MDFAIPCNTDLYVFDFKPWKELEQEQIEKLIEDNQEHLKDITIAKNELRQLKDTMSLIQNEINRLHQVNDENGVLSKLKKLVGIH